MRIHRFFAAIDLSVDATIALPPEAAHHCLQVLRYQTGAELILFNGDGFDYLCQIIEINGKQCQLKVCGKIAVNVESPLQIHLYQGVARGDKMDLIIQKAVELGVTEITPLFSERCNVKLQPKRLEKKLLHWRKVAISASEQCGRAKLTLVHPALQLAQLKTVANALYLQPESSHKVSQLKLADQISLFIGPEGGFSETDIRQLENSQAQGVQSGPRILRTETAGLAVISILQSRFGDMG